MMPRNEYQAVLHTGETMAVFADTYEEASDEVWERTGKHPVKVIKRVAGGNTL